MLSSIEKRILIFVTLFGINFFLFAPTLHIGFLSDDFHMLSITAHQNSVLSYFTHNIIGERSGSSYGPLWNILFSLEYFLFGIKALGYHYVSVFLHSVIALSVFFLGEKIFRKQRIAFAAALMFSVLPGHVEAVSWISVQVHLLATLLFLLAIYCYFCFLEKKKKAYYLLSLFLSFLSLLTKEIGITFFLAIFLVEIFYGGLPQQKNIFEKIGIYALRILKRLLIPFVLLVIYFMLRLHATGVFAGSYSKATFSFDFFASLKTFLEISLSMFFSSHWRNYFASVLLSHLFFFGIGIVFLILAGVFFSKKWGGTFLFLLFLYGVTALPFVELSINPINYEGERYGYLLSVWGAMFIALFFFILSDIWKRKRIKVQSFWFITIFFCCLFSFFTYKKIFLWKNSGEMVQNILQGSQDLSVQEDDVVYFVGMPDNIGGAQVLRNGIVEALEIFSGQSLHGKRIGIFSHFSLDTLGSTTITAKKTKNGFLLEGESALSFTGFPELEEAEFHFTLNDFTMPGFLGSSVQIENRNTFERKENTLLVYFDGVNLRIIE